MTRKNKILIIIGLIVLCFISCNRKTENTVHVDTPRVDSVLLDTLKRKFKEPVLILDTLKNKKVESVFISDSIKRLVVDDFPITNEMLSEKISGNRSHKRQSGNLVSYHKVWFINDTLKQTIIVDLYTDYHRMAMYLFYTNAIPSDLIYRMELNSTDGELASDTQKLKDFDGFFNQAVKINASYFKSHKDFRLGDAKQKAIGIYGLPDKQSSKEGIELLEWTFVGDTFYDAKSDLKGKPLAKRSFGYHVDMYFKKDKLVGYVLRNDIP